MKKYLGILFMSGCLFCIACSSDKKADAAANAGDTTAQEAKGEKAQKPITSLPQEMPAEFKESNIPLFKDAVIQNAAQHNHKSSPKTQVRFNTDASPKEIEEFYIAELKQKGWKVTNSTKEPRENNVHFSVFNNGEKQFLVNSLTHPETKQTVATMIIMDYNIPGSQKKKEDE